LFIFLFLTDVRHYFFLFDAVFLLAAGLRFGAAFLAAGLRFGAAFLAAGFFAAAFLLFTGMTFTSFL
jgi:hypothetical protein